VWRQGLEVAAARCRGSGKAWKAAAKSRGRVGKLAADRGNIKMDGREAGSRATERRRISHELDKPMKVRV
jgi:hypothetical protein